MATLLPSLSSDEEDNASSTKKTKTTTKKKKDRYADDSDDEEENAYDQLNEDFEFGGIMGEDGGLVSGLVGGSSSVGAGWSYEKALENLEKGKSKLAAANPRMDIASIIEAKRRSLKKKGMDDEEDGSGSEGNDDNDDEMDIEEGEANKNETSEEESSGDSSGDSSDDDDDDDDDEVDDADREDMEDDVLTTRMVNEESKKKKGKETSNESESGSDADSGENSSNEEGGSDGSSDDDSSDEDVEEAAKAAKFFDSQAVNNDDEIELFSQLPLSRPILRGVASMGFTKPTPIQASVIPVALAGRDICASAVTGSGKTAAFLLPIMERILHRPVGRIKAIVLTPTRELAAQCLGMLSTLAQFTKIQSTLIVGGSKNVNSQIAELRARPQIVVATPGRLLDHIMNSQGVDIDDVEFLILDEADRLLDLGFQEEVTEIIDACPKERQTLLFSATMNTKVDDLIRLSLKRPVRVKISNKDSKSKELEVAPRLEQEFIRIRAGNEGINREGMLLALLTRTYKDHSIVFFDTKALAHRMMIVCGLCGIKCAELHGNLTQTQRLEALEKFRKGEVDVLLATDLAARGLDINHVQAVINFEMPSQVATYIHRIGRTARAGRGGRSCTLIGEGRRYLMKDIMKDAAQKAKGEQGKNGKASQATSGIIRSRTIPPGVISHFVAKIQSLESHIREVLQAEAIAKMDRLAEMEVMRAQNIIEHKNEINSRPKREWFATEREKQQTREAATEQAKMIKEKGESGLHRMTRKKRRAREARSMLEEDLAEQEERERAEGNYDSGDDYGNDDDNDGESGAPKSRIPSSKLSVKAQKKQAQAKEHERYEQSLYDADLEAEMKKKRKKSKKAAGDDTLFMEEQVTFASKTAANERPSSSFGFRGYDPMKDGRKKPKKKSVHGFKSKSKYKRR